MKGFKEKMKTAKISAAMKNLADIANKGGAVAAGDWTNGSGNFVSKRAIPAGAIEVSPSNLTGLSNRSQRAVRRLMKDRPRVRIVIVVKDWKLAGRAVKLDEAAKDACQAAYNARFAAENAARQAKKLAAVQIVSSLPSSAGMAEWISVGRPHPAPAAVLAAKHASGLSWNEFECSTFSQQEVA